MKASILMTSAALMIGTSPLIAQESMGKHHGSMHTMMKQADSNHDGKISKQEFLGAAAKRAEKRFDRMDANHDGLLDERDRQAHFDKMDRNHDGSISREEFQQFHHAMKKKQRE